MYSVEYHWDKLNVCAVGRTYSPEFFDFVNDSKTRELMKRIAAETNEDLDLLSEKIKSFNVEIIRPEIDSNHAQYKIQNRYLPPPITPRDDMAMIGNEFFMPTTDRYEKWNSIKGDSWPEVPPESQDEWNNLESFIKKELKDFNINCVDDCYYRDYSFYKCIEQKVRNSGNRINYNKKINSAMIFRLGNKLVSGLWEYENRNEVSDKLSKLFVGKEIYIFNSEGHLDGVINPVAEGLLLVSGNADLGELKKIFPDWEYVVVSENNQHSATKEYNSIKKFNNGRWLIPEEFINKEIIESVEYYFDHWLGNSSESSFDINVLNIDQNNIICSNENERIFKILNSYGITPHVVKIRHSAFWDSGIHCFTCDIDREQKNATGF